MFHSYLPGFEPFRLGSSDTLVQGVIRKDLTKQLGTYSVSVLHLMPDFKQTLIVGVQPRLPARLPKKRLSASRKFSLIAPVCLDKNYLMSGNFKPKNESGRLIFKP